MAETNAFPNLTELADRYGSDKGSIVGNAHNYTLFYEMFLAARRDSIRTMLEIGLLRNGPETGEPIDRQTGDLPSIRMWMDYFPKATVHGFDISDFSFFKNPRFVFTRGDAGKSEDLAKIGAGGEVFDFIIDDGSHASFHQQLTFVSLFPKLAKGGLYIIEDLDWQPPVYEEQLPPTIRTANLVSRWFETRRFPDLGGALAPMAGLAEQVSMIQILEQPFIPERRIKAAVIQKAFR